MTNNKEQIIYINFIADINEKTSGLLIYLLTEQIRSGSKNFRINLSSGGGLLFHAVAIHNFLKGLKNVKIHTHNLGQIDSGANLIFLAGNYRTASKASTFLLHPPQMTIQSQGPAQFSIELLKEKLEGLEKDQDKMAEIIADNIGTSAKKVFQMFQDRNTFSSAEAMKLGFISKIEEFVASPGLPIFSITNQS